MNALPLPFTRLLCALFFGGLPLAAAEFSLLNYYPGWSFAPLPSNTFAFPYHGVSFPAFVVATNGPLDLTGKTLVASYRVDASPDAVFRFGGQDVWNRGSTPPHARLFFSARMGYAAEDGCPQCSWWSAAGWCVLSNGTATVSAKLDSSWTDSGAVLGTNPPYTTFAGAAQNVMEVGLSFGGGDFYDVGVGLSAGSATFQMLALEITPVTVCVEMSSDLTNWTELWRAPFVPTNAATFIRARVQP